MPRYYFDVHDGLDINDDIGTDLPDLNCARAEAVRLFASLVAEQPTLFLGRSVIVIEIRTDEGLASRLAMHALEDAA